MLIFLGISIAVLIIIVGFSLLDNWHHRWALRTAHEETMKEMGFTFDGGSGKKEE